MKKNHIFFVVINALVFLVARSEALMKIPHFLPFTLLCTTATLAEAPALAKEDGSGLFYIPMFTTMSGVLFGWLASLWSHGPVDGDVLIYSLLGSVLGYFIGLFIVGILRYFHSFPYFFK